VINPDPGVASRRDVHWHGPVRGHHTADGGTLGDPSRGLLRSEAVVDVTLVPLPRSMDVRSGTLTLHSPLRISVESEWRDVVETFARDLTHRSLGRRVRGRLDDADVIIRKVNDCGDEEYRLSIDEEVTIDASTAAGVAYALTVLRQLGPNALWSSAATLDTLELPRSSLKTGRASRGAVFTWTWLVISSTSRRSVG